MQTRQRNKSAQAATKLWRELTQNSHVTINIDTVYANTSIKVFVTKYALTKGVIEVEGETYDSRYFRVVVPSKRWPDIYMCNDWYESKAAAVDDAKRRIERERENLKRKLERLEEIEGKL